MEDIKNIPFCIGEIEEFSNPSARKLGVTVGLNICDGDCCITVDIAGELESNPPKRSRRSLLFVADNTLTGRGAVGIFKSVGPRRSKSAFYNNK